MRSVRNSLVVQIIISSTGGHQGDCERSLRTAVSGVNWSNYSFSPFHSPRVTFPVMSMALKQRLSDVNLPAERLLEVCVLYVVKGFTRKKQA